ncbi:DUF4112 domain-containing protein [Candidatus Nitrospira salsa]
MAEPLKRLNFAKILAKLLDRQFNIPGTSIQIGLDPVIGLIPGIGDFLTSLAGSTILLVAAQYHLPKIVLFRMGINISINGLIGAIPVFGDLFSIWFKSNVRNIELLEKHIHNNKRSSTFGDWAFVGSLFAGIVVLLIGSILVTTWLIKAVWEKVNSM